MANNQAPIKIEVYEKTSCPLCIFESKQRYRAQRKDKICRLCNLPLTDLEIVSGLKAHIKCNEEQAEKDQNHLTNQSIMSVNWKVNTAL